MNNTIIAWLLLVFAAAACGPVHHQGHVSAVHEIQDRNSVIAAADRLFICTDNRDWACVKDVFAPEVLFDMTSLTGGRPEKKTPQQIADMWEQGLKSLTAIHHQAGNYRVAINGNEADLFCYATAWHYLPNPAERNTRIFVGSYHEHFVKGDSGWKMDQFKFNLKFIDGNKDLEGSAKKQ